MKNLLIEDLVKNVWIYPEEDKQYIEKPVELSKLNGVLNVFEYPFVDNVRMPESGRRFMLYQIGHNDPSSLGMERDSFDTWFKASELVKDQGFIFNFIIDDLLVDLSQLYVIILRNNLMLMALDLTHYREAVRDREITLFRTYSNRVYNDYSGATKMTYTSAVIVDDVMPKPLSDYTAAITNKFFVDGMLVLEPSYVIAREFKTCALQIDPLVDRVHTFDLSTTKWFTSSVDAKTYHILNRVDAPTVDYHDDTDFFLIGKKEIVPGYWAEVGIYITNEKLSNIKSLSQTDYVLDSAKVERIKTRHTDIDFTETYVKAYARINDKNKKLIGDGNLLKQLGGLPLAIRNALITDTNSNIDFWKAENILSSKIVEVMGMTTPEYEAKVLDPQGFRGLYSYFGAMELLEGDNKERDLKQIDGGDVYSVVSFDTNGLLTGMVNVPTRELYNTINDASSEILTIIHSRDTNSIPVYDPLVDVESDISKARVMRLNSSYPWKEAKMGTDYTVDPDKKIIWNNELAAYEKGLRTAGDNTARTIVLTREMMALWIPLVVNYDANEIKHIEAVRYELFLNGKRLVKGLDYIHDYPNVKLTNFSFLKPLPETDNTLVILSHGLPLIVEAKYVPISNGWVEDGAVMADGVYNFTDGMFNDMFINGSLVKDFKVAETGAGTMPAWVKDGMPFSLIPRIQHVNDKFLEEFALDREQWVDKLAAAEAQVSQILPEFIPETDSKTTSEQYLIVSPLISTLVNDIKGGSLVIRPGSYTLLTETVETNEGLVDISGSTTDPKIAAILNNYLTELNNDPCYVRDDEVMFKVYPTHLNVFTTLTESEYYFINRVNKLYLGGKCNLSLSLAIGI